MTALLSRRDDRCLSDLTMDRFLLGETNDSDEGRMLQRHLVWCSTCLARMQSLRTLYAHADMPEVTSDPAPVPTPGPMKAQQPDRVTGVVELILMRDGLLIGTEVFTPGVWVLGSGPRANLKLESKGVAPEHAKLTFRNDVVVVERAQGPVLVNGFRVERSEVRPIDELIVGPFVVRARVINGRWSEEAPSKFAPTRNVRALNPLSLQSGERGQSEQSVEEETQLVTVPEVKVEVKKAEGAQLSQQLSLRLDLYWGDTLQASELLAGEVPSSAFPAFAPGREPSASAVKGGYRLCIPGAKVEILQGTQWVTAGDELTLTPDMRARVRDGALRLEARLQPAPGLVAPKPKTELLRGSFVPVLSFMMVALLVFSGMASTYEGEEDAFAPRTMPKLSVSLIPPPKKVVEPVKQPDKNTASDTKEPARPRPTPPPPAASARRPPPHLAGLSGMTKVLEAAAKLSKLPLPTMAPGKNARPDMFASLGKVGKEGGKNGLGIDIGADDPAGIGRTGLKFAGRMKNGKIGKSSVGGQLVGPLQRDDFKAPIGSIDRDAVLKVITQHLAEVSSCYERALLSNPSLSGKLTYEWGIGLDGKVTVIKLKNATMKEAGVAACISSSMKKWTFPKPHGGTVTVSFPFMFQPTGF